MPKLALNRSAHLVSASFAASASELEDLRRLSARIGCDQLLVQASSGNTSLKLNGALWIKASGQWLADASDREIFVPVSLSQCRDCLNAGEPVAPLSVRNPFGSCLQPSIETFMHAVLPQRVVVHVHCVDTIAWAIRCDAEEQLTERLSGLRWQWIPYVSSGVPLARAVRTASRRQPHTAVFILGNHGLVVCGETCEAVESLLNEVRLRLAVSPRPIPHTDHSKLQIHLGSSSRWKLPCSQAIHSLATDPLSRKVIEYGILYPCQAVFLGPRVATQQLLSDRRQYRIADSVPFLLVEGCGVLVNTKIKPTEQAVLDGFVEVVRRIDSPASVRYLSASEVQPLLSTGGDQYRISAEIGSQARYG